MHAFSANFEHEQIPKHALRAHCFPYPDVHQKCEDLNRNLALPRFLHIITPTDTMNRATRPSAKLISLRERSVYTARLMEIENEKTIVRLVRKRPRRDEAKRRRVPDVDRMLLLKSGGVNDHKLCC